MSKVLAYLREEDGASAAEYALILAIVGTAIAVAMIFLGGTIANTVDKASNCIASPTSSAACT
jgi:pilus assembly protein Flp/PilA